MYREAALSCFRFLGFTSFDQVDRLTIPEYNLLMQAVRLRCPPLFAAFWRSRPVCMHTLPEWLPGPQAPKAPRASGS